MYFCTFLCGFFGFWGIKKAAFCKCRFNLLIYCVLRLIIAAVGVVGVGGGCGGAGVGGCGAGA